MSSAPDPLGVRAGSAFVMQRARDVRINRAAVRRVARQIAATERTPGSWADYHLGERHLSDDDLANYVLVLDALNFYFWGEPRWRVSYAGETDNGYRALTLALRRALDEGYPITDAGYLASIPTHDVAMILRGEAVIPEFAARVHHLREAGQYLSRSFDGRFLRCAQTAGGSFSALLRDVISAFPSFVDVASYQGRAIPFYKRAQILVTDLAAAFADRASVSYSDPGAVTAFADYKVPQVLHQLGVLGYSPALQSSLTSLKILPAGSSPEIEIRAATILAVSEIASEIGALGKSVHEFEVDWYLWDLGQSLVRESLPYHRTPTTAY